MELHGGNLIGGTVSKAGARTFRGVDPTSGRELDPAFHEAGEDEVDRALVAAAEAFETYKRRPPETIARFLETIAAELEALGEALIRRAQQESALPEARLTGERGRTCGQLRMFAELVREGSWVDVRIDRALPDRKPLPRPDLRRMLVPLGPVAVFGASNFPLAFSVAGGDTASALAAGNTVVVKGHPAHPGTSEMAAAAIARAAEASGLPAGVFSMVHGTTPAVGLALVRHRETRAVAFTGSLTAGRALFDAAAARPVPIPVFSEMGSINPVFVLPGALAARGAEIAQAYVQSVTLGVGQFCTNPGVAFGLAGATLDRFVQETADRVAQAPAATMLHAGIADRFRSGVDGWGRVEGVKAIARSTGEAAGAQAAAVVFATDAARFLEDARLQEEIFGPATLVVACDTRERLYEVARRLSGQLTVTLHATPEDVAAYGDLVAILREKAGRLVMNAFPTGVEVSPAMQHGGPYPATTDARFTSVGTAAILRFARPVCYQGFPAEWLPAELQDGNPRKIWRTVNGERTKE
jgi:alpha-ketoglutaric semialdehyde dehydrogenase